MAALSILFFHLFRNSAMAGVLDRVLPVPLKAILDVSRNGVAIFFVISGFVIAYTTRKLGSRIRDAVRFTVRRQVRLDPPYYVVLVAVASLVYAERLVPGLVYRELSLKQFVVNMFYLQGFTGEVSLLAVAWTLCLEVQFYLFVVLVAVVVGWFVPGTAPRPRRRAVQRWLLLGVGGVSLASPFVGINFGPWFVGTWWMFCIGMVLCWFMLGELSLWATSASLVAVGAWCRAVDLFTASPDPWHGQWTAWLTAAVIFVLLRTGWMARRPPRWLMFFGTISYSLYLVHLPVIDYVLGAGYKVTKQSGVGAVALYVVGAIISIGVAGVLQRFVERPAMRWSAHLKPAAERTDSPATSSPGEVLQAAGVSGDAASGVAAP